MKIRTMIGVAAAVGAVMSVDAATIQYSDLDVYAGSGILLDAAHPTYTGNLGISIDDADGIADQAGYVPGSGLVAVFAGLTFTAADGNFLSRSITYKLQGDASSTPFTSGAGLAWAINDTVIGGALTTIVNDGDIDFTITYLSGPAFYLSTATITALGNDRKVPDGGSIAMLMGIGLTGLGIARRRS